MITRKQKQARIERAERHVRLDQLVSDEGLYFWLKGELKCSSIGCDFIDIRLAQGANLNDLGKDHCAVVAAHDGTPEWLEQLRAWVFEGLSEEHHAWWHVEHARALPIGIDLQPAFHLICIKILEFCLLSSEQWPEPYRWQINAAIELTMDHHKDPSAKSAETARTAASAAAEPARSAARSKAGSMAGSMAKSAYLAADSAACSAGGFAFTAAMCAADSVVAAKTAWSPEELAAFSAADPSAYSAADLAMRSAADWAEWWAYSAAVDSAWKHIADDVIAVFKSMSENLENA